jgi:hypothetical protein
MVVFSQASPNGQEDYAGRIMTTRSHSARYGQWQRGQLDASTNNKRKSPEESSQHALAPELLSHGCVLFALLRVTTASGHLTLRNGERPKEIKMLGWTILFGLMSFSGVVPILAGYPSPLFLKTASLLFAALFLISVLTRAVRDQGR